MKIIKNDNVVCFDVDNTLIMSGLGRNGIKVRSPWANTEYVDPIQKHVDLLIKYSNEGRIVIVWSATGYEWVQTICKALKITKYVTLMMGKPSEYVDDLDANEWMTRNYLS